MTISSAGTDLLEMAVPSGEAKLNDFLFRQIDSILREPVGRLLHSYFVPGGIFHDELWDWDSFWISRAVLNSGSLPTAARQRFLAHAEGSWRNFFDQQGANGAVPIMIKSDGRDFFGCTQEGGIEKNHAKPIFGQFALDISMAKEDFSWLAPDFDKLLRFYQRWRERYLSACGLLVWGSDVAIGVDSDPATYGRPEFSSANLLLNCLFHADLVAASQISDRLGRPGDARNLRAEAEALGESIRQECWDEGDRFFYTVDVNVGDHRDHYLPGLPQGMAMTWKTLPLKIKMFTGFLPLWCGIATPDQARKLVERHWREGGDFFADHGVRTLAKSERMYDPETDSANPSNWLGPVWVLANYLVFEGLKNYGYTDEAHDLAARTRRLLGEDLNATGTLHECYHPETGAPNFNADFLSWNLLALLMSGDNSRSGHSSTAL